MTYGYALFARRHSENKGSGHTQFFSEAPHTATLFVQPLFQLDHDRALYPWDTGSQYPKGNSFFTLDSV